jgi:ornithine--oxo-acid transaminase
VETKHQSSADLIRLAEEFSAHNYHPLPVVLSKGEGVWVWDVEGKKYMDMLSSYSALNQGHLHPRIIGAVKDQVARLTLTSRAFHNDQFGAFCELMCKTCDMDSVLLMNTGAEAVETAIKAARKWGYLVKGVPEDKAEIIVCENNFHGRTTTIVGFSSEEQYRKGFGPYGAGFKMIPYSDLDALRGAITPNTVGFLVEPIQGEAGIIVPEDGFLKEARQILKAENILLMLDEIQTGLGRTGKMFCYEYEDAKPDILIVGKALGGGVFPVSGMLSSKEVMDVFTPGDHGSTFGGNPLGCAVGTAALRVILDEELPRKSFESGAYFMDRLLQIGSPHVEEIRGRGLLIGVEIKKSSGVARPFCERLMELGILAKETHHQVIRFAPPLVITREEMDWALERIEKVLT